MDKFVCEECGNTSPDKKRSCPLCDGSMVNIEEGIEDNTFEDEEETAERPGSMARDDFDLEADLAM